ncbi:MAG: secretin and TonB N-terminal domain-containing protein [bacterium]|nr:secretin and TonB N-terminal domain-containing protein [bacterium]
MSTIHTKGWGVLGAMVLAAALLAVQPAARAADEAAGDAAAANPIAQYAELTGGAPGVALPAPVLAAQAAEVPLPPPAAGDQGTTASAVGGGGIQIIFSQPENDILAKQAMEKLDVMVDSLVFPDAKLSNVIRTIGERLNINFIFDAEDITGNVTLRLHNVRLRDALDSILTTRKLAIVVDASGIFRIVPQEQVGRKTVETHTEVIQLNWVSAADVVKTLKPFISDDVGRLEFNEESNVLIVTDVPPQIEVVKDLVSQLDKAERQVLVEARLVDINIDAARDLGTEWSAVTDETLNAVIQGITVAAGEATLGFGDKIGIFGNTYNLNAIFRALETRNVAELLANPRVTTLNNVPAQIQIIQRIPYLEAVQGPTQNSQVAEVEFEDSGVDIKVTPIITPNDFVRMQISLKQSIFRGRVGTDDENPLGPPKIDERNADTNVIVADGNTVVLGGLRQQNEIEDTLGVPWFHEIPFFGWLFKDKHYDNAKTELVLMVTPKIVKDKISLTDNEKYWYDRIDAKWNLPDTFFDQTGDVGEGPKVKK